MANKGLADVIMKKNKMGRRRLNCVHIDRETQSGQIRVSHVRKETAEGEACWLTRVPKRSTRNATKSERKQPGD